MGSFRIDTPVAGGPTKTWPSLPGMILSCGGCAFYNRQNAVITPSLSTAGQREDPKRPRYSERASLERCVSTVKQKVRTMMLTGHDSQRARHFGRVRARCPPITVQTEHLLSCAPRATCRRLLDVFNKPVLQRLVQESSGHDLPPRGR
jgi:hypothetical protein